MKARKERLIHPWSGDDKPQSTQPMRVGVKHSPALQLFKRMKARQHTKNWRAHNLNRARQAVRDWRKRNPDKYAAMKKRHYVKHRESYLLYYRMYRQDHLERIQEYDRQRAKVRGKDPAYREQSRINASLWRETHREQERARYRRYEAEHREERREKNRRYAAEHPNRNRERREYMREYQRANRDKINARQRAKYAAERQQEESAS